VREVFAAQGSDVAAIACEPYVLSYGCAPPAPGFLELLRDLATRHGTVLVFDEAQTGFRHHLGGYQAIAGVTPDLTAFGNALANGYTIAGLAGRAELLDLLVTQVAIDGTRRPSPCAIAAGLATIDILRRGGIERLYALGERLREGLRRATRDRGVAASVTGVGSGFAIAFRATPPVTFRHAAGADLARAEAFRRAMLDAGILLPPRVLTPACLCLAASGAPGSCGEPSAR
jgi:glutamate-1-semialdehyde 2,1-aminomutase